MQLRSMLDDEQRQEVTALVNWGLDRAERIWDKHGFALDEARAYTRADSADLAKSERVLSRIPGHKHVESGNEKVGTFVALAADMRDSTTHLLCAIAEAKVSQMQRVFYETSALLPALERTIQYEEGAVTEYLGDGVLALFEVDESDKESTVRASFRAADNCIGDTREIVNEAIEDRYRLPPLNIGVGLAMTKAVVSLVGLEGSSHAKAYGRCVYSATKLSSGINEITVDEYVKAAWPVSKAGLIHFERRTRRKVDGYVVSRKSRD
jgi:class 3 adenylate cyclase